MKKKDLMAEFQGSTLGGGSLKEQECETDEEESEHKMLSSMII